MLNMTRMRFVAAGLAWLAMAAASVAVAQDNSSSSTQSNQNGQQSNGQSSSIQTAGVQANASWGKRVLRIRPICLSLNRARPSNRPRRRS